MACGWRRRWCGSMTRWMRRCLPGWPSCGSCTVDPAGGSVARFTSGCAPFRPCRASDSIRAIQASRSSRSDARRGGTERRVSWTSSVLQRTSSARPVVMTDNSRMQQRIFGRMGWHVGDVGYGMWGMGGWTGSDDDESRASLARAVDLGCNFFDTAWAYGMGHSERLLGDLVKMDPDTRLFTATKIPPKNAKWPARAEYPLDDVFPADHIREFTEKSLENLGLPALDLMQFHVWSDAWADDVTLAARGAGAQGRGAGRRGRHQHQSLGTGERDSRAAHRPDRRRAGGLQHLRPGAGRRAVPGVPGARTSRSSRACRSTRARSPAS